MNKDMTLTELRREKLALEEEMANRIQEFSQRTGVRVSDVGLSQVQQRRGTGYLVNLILELG